MDTTTIVVIACPGCGEWASTDGHYRLLCLGRTIGPKLPNGYQPHCSACRRAIARWVEDEASKPLRYYDRNDA